MMVSILAFRSQYFVLLPALELCSVTLAEYRPAQFTSTPVDFMAFQLLHFAKILQTYLGV